MKPLHETIFTDFLIGHGQSHFKASSGHQSLNVKVGLSFKINPPKVGNRDQNLQDVSETGNQANRQRRTISGSRGRVRLICDGRRRVKNEEPDDYSIGADQWDHPIRISWSKSRLGKNLSTDLPPSIVDSSNGTCLFCI
jgi:hypothetical protein